MNIFKKIRLGLLIVFRNKSLPNPVYIALIIAVTGSAFGQFDTFKNIRDLIQKTNIDARAQFRNIEKENCLGTNPDLTQQLQFSPGATCRYVEYDSGLQCCNYIYEPWLNNPPPTGVSQIIRCTAYRVTPCPISFDVNISPVTIKIDVPDSAGSAAILKVISTTAILPGQNLNGANFLPPFQDGMSYGQITSTPVGIGTVFYNNYAFEFSLQPTQFDAFKNQPVQFEYSVRKAPSGRCGEVVKSSQVILSASSISAIDDNSSSEGLDNPLPEITLPDGTKKKEKAIYIMNNDGTANTARKNLKLDVLQNDTPSDGTLKVDSIADVVFPAGSAGQTAPVISDAEKKITTTAPYGFTGAGSNQQKEITFNYKIKKDTTVSENGKVTLAVKCFKGPAEDEVGSQSNPIPAYKLVKAFDYNGGNDVMGGLNAQGIKYGLGYYVRFPSPTDPDAQNRTDATGKIVINGKNYKVKPTLQGKVSLEKGGTGRADPLCTILGNGSSSSKPAAVQTKEAVKRVRQKILGRSGSIPLLNWVKANGPSYPLRSCYKVIAEGIDATGGFGGIPAGFNFPSVKGTDPQCAVNFGAFLDQPGKLEQLGLIKVDSDDPFDAQAGEIVVIRQTQGFPSYCGDINVADGNGNFYNYMTLTPSAMGGSSAWKGRGDARIYSIGS